MKKLLFVLLPFAIACSSAEDPQPVAKIADQPTGGQTCQDIVAINAHTGGVEISLTVELGGYFDDVVVKAETRTTTGGTLSSYRRPTDKDATTISFAFGSRGETVYLGAFPCGGNASNSGRACKLIIKQGNETTVINSKVGDVRKYLVK